MEQPAQVRNAANNKLEVEAILPPAKIELSVDSKKEDAKAEKKKKLRIKTSLLEAVIRADANKIKLGGIDGKEIVFSDYENQQQSYTIKLHKAGRYLVEAQQDFANPKYKKIFKAVLDKVAEKDRGHLSERDRYKWQLHRLRAFMEIKDIARVSKDARDFLRDERKQLKESKDHEKTEQLRKVVQADHKKRKENKKNYTHLAAHRLAYVASIIGGKPDRIQETMKKDLHIKDEPLLHLPLMDEIKLCKQPSLLGEKRAERIIKKQ
jgi:hypothetical protein